MSLHRLRACIVLSIVLGAALGTTSAQPLAGEKASGYPKKISWKAANMHEELEQNVDRAVAKSIEDGQMSGCVVLVGRRDGIVFEKAYGYRAVEPKKELMTTD